MDEYTHALIVENTRLVHACARRFVGRGVEYDDLYQNGCLGLVKAANGFEPQRGLQFSTYAVPVILGEIKRLFRDGGSVSVSRRLKELSYKTIREKERLTLALSREPTVGELAEKMGVSAAEIGEALCVATPILSLTAADPQNGEEGQLDLAVEDDSPALTEKIALQAAVDRLEARDRRLVQLRYFDGKTQSETGRALGMTQVQVSRREKAIVTYLRRMLA